MPETPESYVTSKGEWDDARRSGSILPAVNELLIHELAHQFSGDHLSSEYHDALSRLGAKLATWAAGGQMPGCLDAWMPGCLDAWMPGCLAGGWSPLGFDLHQRRVRRPDPDAQVHDTQHERDGRVICTRGPTHGTRVKDASAEVPVLVCARRQAAREHLTFVSGNRLHTTSC